MIKEKTAKIIRYDGKVPRTVLEGFTLVQGQPNPMYGYVEDENGFPIYEMTQRFAGHLVTERPDRYRLYQTKPFRVKKIKRPSMSASYPMLYSWRYIKSSVADGEDPENKEKKFKTVYEWQQGDERNPFSGPVETEKKIHSQVREVEAPTEDLKKAAPKTPPPTRNQFSIAAELRKKLGDLLPGGADDATNHVKALNKEIGKIGGGSYKKAVFVKFVKGMEALIEQYSKKEEEPETEE